MTGFTQAIEGDEIVVRYDGKECLRGKYVPPAEDVWRGRKVFLGDKDITPLFLGMEEDVNPDAIVEG